jgi:hypothetical protein
MPGEPKQFFITVHPDNDDKSVRRFCTKKIISSFGAEPLRGRGTRVFEAIEIDKHGNERSSAVVMKDIWIDHDRVREDAIVAKLHAQADNENKSLWRSFFSLLYAMETFGRSRVSSTILKRAHARVEVIDGWDV